MAGPADAHVGRAEVEGAKADGVGHLTGRQPRLGHPRDHAGVRVGVIGAGHLDPGAGHDVAVTKASVSDDEDVDAETRQLIGQGGGRDRHRRRHLDQTAGARSVQRPEHLVAPSVDDGGDHTRLVGSALRQCLETGHRHRRHGQRRRERLGRRQPDA
jgi:hypothetical protein